MTVVRHIPSQILAVFFGRGTTSWFLPLETLSWSSFSCRTPSFGLFLVSCVVINVPKSCVSMVMAVGCRGASLVGHPGPQEGRMPGY